MPSEAIERFAKMAQADPTNELGHFSLGRALLDDGQNAEAAASFARVIELNPNMGRAYQLLATALLNLDRRDEAIGRLAQGVKVAQSRGETLPKREMIAKLKELGITVPDDEPAAPAVEIGSGQVLCKRCGKIAPKLASPPMRNAFGREIFEHTCADCWQEAIRVGTKVINELRLPLGDPKAGKIWDQHVREFLNLAGEEH
jgi:Fe-S cluster biosynthesis and repair protein YggX